jgi:Mg/Co/Ni transporter MgtE
MHALLTGFISGAVSGIVMGLISHMLFRLNIFKSSLIIIDGSFLFRILKYQGSPRLIAGAGLCIHLVTSGVFGALYPAATTLLKLGDEVVRSFPLISLYVTLLWLSMLFIALPVAGEGFLGRRSGRISWLEQLTLHGIFCILYFVLVRIFL